MIPNNKQRQQLFSTTSAQTFAPSPVWRGSKRIDMGELKAQPLPRRDRARLYRSARRFEQQTRARAARGHQDGKLGRNGLMVLNALLFVFHNERNGRCDPSYETIARAACCSVSSVYRGLKRLKDAGVLHWIRRCAAEMVDGRFTLVQYSNAYAFLSENNWRGFTPAPDPIPQPGTWGDPERIKGGLESAAEAAARGGQAKILQQSLELEPGDRLAASLARLGRLIQR